MTNKELIQTLRYCGSETEYQCNGCPGERCCDEGGHDKILLGAADRLEALLAENEHLREVTKMIPKWVSVEERLPELNVMVVGITKDNPFSQYVPQVVHRNEHGWVFTYSMRYVTDVTHWMPLPSTEGVE